MRQNGFFKDLWYGIKLAWVGAWGWRRVYKSEKKSQERWENRRKAIK